jgi:hypothetical protein
MSCFWIREGPSDDKIRVCLICRGENAGEDGFAGPENGIIGKDGVLFERCLKCGETDREDEYGERPRQLCESCHSDDMEREYFWRQESRLRRRRGEGADRGKGFSRRRL